MGHITPCLIGHLVLGLPVYRGITILGEEGGGGENLKLPLFSGVCACTRTLLI